METQRKGYTRPTRQERKEQFASIGKGKHSKGTVKPHNWRKVRKDARKCAARSRKINWRR